MELIENRKCRTIEILRDNSNVEDHEALVSTDTLIQLDVLNKTWLYATRQEHEDNSPIYENREQIRPKMILCIVATCNESSHEKGVAFISEESAFNILYPDLDAFNSFQEGKKVKIFLYLMKNAFSEPPVADKITISAVRSPILSSIPEDYDHCLKRYFSQRRHLVLNQIFSLPYAVDKKSKIDENDTQYLWFNVTQLEHGKSSVSSAWIWSDITAMSESGSLNSIVPCKTTINADLVSLVNGFPEQFELVMTLCRPIMKDLTGYSNVSLLLHGPPAAGKRCIALLVAKYLHLHLYEVNCCDFTGESLAAMEQRIKGLFDKAAYFSPCLLLLKNIHSFCKGKDDDGEEPRLIKYLSDRMREFSLQDKVVTIATTNSIENISSTVSRLFTYEIEIGPPDENGRLRILKALLPEKVQCNLEVISKQTAGMVLGDFQTLVSEAASSAIKRLNFEEKEERFEIIQEDIDSALDKIHAEYKEMLGMPAIPQVLWSDVGGLASVKEEIIDTIKLPMQYPELISKGLRRSGLLLYGPPGCGKTLLAKAVATEFALNFFSVKGPELMNMYVGQSEQNVRDMFQKARESSPCIIFFDELDSIAPNRGRSGDSGGVMDRIVSQLLAELDGLQSSNDLFVIGATNRPDLLDNSLLRPGRFDKMVYVGFPETKEERLNIMRSYTNKMRLSRDVDLDQIEDALPLFLTGADFYALCTDAYLNGIKRCIKNENMPILQEDNQIRTGDSILIQMCDFETSLKELVPSVSTNDVLKYKEIKTKIEGERKARE